MLADVFKFMYNVGAVGVIWSIMWFFLVYNSPAEHPRISGEERDYIEKALNKKAKDKVQIVNVSYIKIVIRSSLLSLPVLDDTLRRRKVAYKTPDS